MTSNTKTVNPVIQVHIWHLAFLRSRIFYWTLVVGGLLTTSHLLSIINNETNPYHVQTWASWLVIIVASIVFGYALWAAKETKHTIKEKLPSLPKFDTHEAQMKVIEDLSNNVEQKKLNTLNTLRSWGVLVAVFCFAFTNQKLGNATEQLPLLDVSYSVVPAVISTIVVVVTHSIILSKQKRMLRTSSENTQTSVLAKENDQQLS